MFMNKLSEKLLWSLNWMTGLFYNFSSLLSRVDVWEELIFD